MVEFRKLISFGKSSYVVSLPKKWVEKNKLKRGDNISITVDNDKLMLSSKVEKEEAKEKTISISVNDKPIAQISREIIPAYVNNNKNIILFGDQIKDKAVEIRGILHGLMALEIMEQSSDKIIARDFLDMQTIDVIAVLRKMDNIVRSMISDMGSCFKEKKSAHIWDMDKDVNRLYNLLSRAVKFRLNNPSFDKPYPLSSENLFKAWQAGKFLEKIGDDIKEISKIIEQNNLTKVEKEMVSLINEVNDLYTNTMKAYHTNDIALAYKCAPFEADLLKKSDIIYEKHWNIKNISGIIEKLKDSIEIVHDMGRKVYN